MSSNSTAAQSSSTDVHTENELLRSKLDRIAEVLRVWRADLAPDNTYRTIVHDVRNLVNEVVLLRQLADLEDEEAAE